MTPRQIKLRRMELGLETSELARALHLTERELVQIEAGENRFYETAAFEDAFAELEERVFGTYAGA
jgi:transcriptional regulator with XRE-family HTH domain